MKTMTTRMMIGFATLVFCSATAGTDKMPEYRSPIHFMPAKRAVGDVMPFYWKGEYHVFYLLNNSGNADIDWEHAVSKDLVHWRNLPAAIVHDPADKTGPEGGCMFTGSIIEDHGTFHAFYTSWNPENPAGREFVCHATSKDLVSWIKHPNDMFGPDGIHYANHRERDFRGPCVVWDAEQKQFVMYVNANQPGRGGFVFGHLTSQDLKQWQQLPAIENIPGDECPDFFKAGGTYYLHGCNVYASAKDENGPWKFASYNRVERRMAAKRVFDGKRHVWFGGWLNGPMSIPREVYEGPEGLLFMKPVPEVVNVFSEAALSVSNLSLVAGTTWTKEVPQDYLLEATIDLSKGRELGFTVRGDGIADACRMVLSADKKMLTTTGGQSWESRPLPIDFARPVTVQAFILGGIAEVFVNSQYAATFFIRPGGGTLGLESRGSVVIQSLQVRTPVTRNPLNP
jgi:sucrose-6-phosphate hydrolase SacC (GH32 family)